MKAKVCFRDGFYYTDGENLGTGQLLNWIWSLKNLALEDIIVSSKF